MRWTGHIVCMVEMRFLVGKPEGKPPLGRCRLKSEGNIKMDLQEVGLRSMDWNNLTLNVDRWWVLVNAVMNLWVQYNVGNF